MQTISSSGEAPTPPSPPTAPSRLGEKASSPWKRHGALAAVFLSTLMISIDSSMVNVALPHIKDDFDAGSSVTWVVLAYLLGLTVSLPLTGWISGRWGTRRPFLMSIALFGVASILAAFAPNLALLASARGLVGLVGSPLIPLSMTMLMVVYPPERRGWAISMWSAAAVLGPALGPAVGGRLADLVSWHWLFLGVAPLAAATWLLSRATLPTDDTYHRTHGAVPFDAAPSDAVPSVAVPSAKPLDVRGMLLGPPALSLIVLAVAQGNQWGWSSALTVGLLSTGFALFVLFVFHELRIAQPMLDLRLIRLPNFLLGASLSGLAVGAMQARLIFVPLELDDVRGYSTGRIGNLFLIVAALQAVGMMAAGRLVDRIGPRRPLIIGALILLAGALLISRWTPTTPLGVVVGELCFHAIGVGMYMGPTVVVSLSHVSAEAMPLASTLRQIFQQLGSVLSSSLLGALLATRLGGAATAGQIQDAYNSLFLVLAVVAAVMVVLTTRIPRGTMRTA